MVPRNLFWTGQDRWERKRWEAEILEQIPDQRIAWQSIDGTPNSGEVTFEPLDEERTRVILTMEYEPEGFLGEGGRCIGYSFWPSRRRPQAIPGFHRRKRNRDRRLEWPDRTRRRAETPFLQASKQNRIRPRSDTANNDCHSGSRNRALSWDPTHRAGRNKRLRLSGSLGALHQIADVPRPLKLPVAALQHEPELAVGAPDEPQFYRDTASIAAPTHEEIAERAYEIYLERGQAPGYEVENWLQAEKELSEKLGATHSEGRNLNAIDGGQIASQYLAYREIPSERSGALLALEACNGGASGMTPLRSVPTSGAPRTILDRNLCHSAMTLRPHRKRHLQRFGRGWREQLSRKK